MDFGKIEAHRELIRSCWLCFPEGGNAPVADVVKEGARAMLVGGLAIKEVLGAFKLSEAVGTVFRRDGIVYVPLPHPSGASTWLNSLENKERLEESLAMLGEIMSGARESKKNVERGA